METDFKNLLTGDPAILALVSTRIYPSTYAQASSDPAARYQKITGNMGLHMQGSDGLSTDLMQVDVRSGTAAESLALKSAIVARLHGFEGLQGSTNFRLIALRDDRGIKFEKTDSKSYYTASLDFDVYSKQAA
jgi:hypothetical protein